MLNRGQGGTQPDQVCGFHRRIGRILYPEAGRDLTLCHSRAFLESPDPVQKPFTADEIVGNHRIRLISVVVRVSSTEIILAEASKYRCREVMAMADRSRDTPESCLLETSAAVSVFWVVVACSRATESCCPTPDASDE